MWKKLLITRKISYKSITYRVEKSVETALIKLWDSCGWMCVKREWFYTEKNCSQLAGSFTNGFTQSFPQEVQKTVEGRCKASMDWQEGE